MATAYADFLRNLPIPWLTGSTEGQIYWSSIGNEIDKLLERAKNSAKAKYPEYSPADALALIAFERSIVRGPTESEEFYRIRVKQAWEDHSRNGSPFELLLQLHYAEFPNAVIVQQNGIFHYLNNNIPTLENFVVGDLATFPENGPWWTSDLDFDFTSRFWILLPNLTEDEFNDFVTNQDTRNRFRAVLDEWTPAKATFLGVVIWHYDHIGTRVFGWPVQTFQGIADAYTSFGNASSLTVRYSYATL